jgi:hypothetical protein
MLPKLVSTSDICALFGVTRKTVAVWTAAGMLERVAHGRFDLAKSVRAFAKHAKHGAGGETIATEVGSERARLLKAQADRAELQLKVERKDLVPFSEGVATAAAMTHLFRSSLLAFRTRLGGRLSLTRADGEIVYEQACEILTELSQANDYADHLQAVAQAAVEKELASAAE